LAREDGLILEDEILIKRRVIDEVIRKEKPSYIAFFERPKHTALFKGAKNKNAPLLDEAYTSLFRSASNWNEEFSSHVDAFLLHGRAWVEILEVEGESNPFQFEYVETVNLLHPLSARHPDDCAVIARQYDLTKGELDEYAETYDFDEEIVEKMKDQCFDSTYTTSRVYHVFTKDDNGFVKHSWVTDGHLGRDKVLDGDRILVEESDFELGGRRQAKYPFILARLETRENPRIVESHGYAFMVEDDQEASTNIWTAVINGGVRASRLYPYVDQERGPDSNEVKQLQVSLEPGKLSDAKLDFLRIPWPGTEMISLAQALGVTGAQERGQPDVAATNRRDSRKTATEMQVAQQMAEGMRADRLTGYSAFWRRLLKRHWGLVVENIDQISFLEDQPDEIREALINDIWTLEPGGSTEYLARQESIQAITQILGLVQGTPMYAVLVTKLVELSLPQFYTELAQSVQKDQIGVTALQALASVPLDGLPPETVQQINQLIQTGEELYAVPIEGPNRLSGAEAGRGGGEGGATGPERRTLPDA